MIEAQAIQKLSDQIARVFHPERIILFGSYAYGTPTNDSDVDLLVVLQHQGKGSHKAAEILCYIRPSFPVDVLMRTLEQVQQRLQWNDFFVGSRCRLMAPASVRRSYGRLPAR